MKDIIYVYITNPSHEEAVLLARHLLKKRVIGCANLIPITSLYWWEGKIEEGGEVVLLAKTNGDMYEAVRREVESVHPYSVPCVVRIPVSANERYFEWLQESLHGPETNREQMGPPDID